MKSKKRITKIIILLIATLFLLFPIKTVYKDGGTVKYQAVLYSYTKYHKIIDADEIYEGTEFEIFPFNFIN